MEPLVLLPRIPQPPRLITHSVKSIVGGQGIIGRFGIGDRKQKRPLKPDIHYSSTPPRIPNTAPTRSPSNHTRTPDNALQGCAAASAIR
ncbi:hypothetical protein B7486_00895 [cyanobacterium TDX16]|nr:hypothetical protein B7486_00895 [cyanobacterium TDX16]